MCGKCRCVCGCVGGRCVGVGGVCEVCECVGRCVGVWEGVCV